MTPPTALRLAPHILLGMDDCVGQVVELLAGALWLTEQGDPQDHCLYAGMRHRVRRPGRVLMQACGARPAVLRIDDGGARHADFAEGSLQCESEDA